MILKSLRLTIAGTPINKTSTKKATTPKKPATPKKSMAATPGPVARKQTIETLETKKNKDSGGPRLVPGDRSRTSTFLPKGWQLEGQCAAYLGFAEIQHLRRFAISPMVLNAFGVGQANTWPTPGTRWQLEGQCEACTCLPFRQLDSVLLGWARRKLGPRKALSCLGNLARLP
jgi:hypothetical protein